MKESEPMPLMQDEMPQADNLPALQSLIEEMVVASQDYKGYSESFFFDTIAISPKQKGYKNIVRLVSYANIEGQADGLIALSKGSKKKIATTSFARTLSHRIKANNEGVFAVIGVKGDLLYKCLNDEFPREPEFALEFYKNHFGDNILVGVERPANHNDGNGKINQVNEYNEKLLDFVESNGLTSFAMNNAIMCDEDEYHVHDIKDAIIQVQLHDSPNRLKDFFHGQYLKSWEEISNIYSDYPELTENAEKLDQFFDSKAQGMSDIHIDLDKPVLPAFPIPDGFTPTSYMRKLAEDGLKEHLEKKFKKDFKTDDLSSLSDSDNEQMLKQKKIYFDQLDFEVNTIDNMGFSGYFLIVSDFIVWAKDNGVPVGPGRGSGAGSIVAYGLKITNIDPIKHQLLFERFLNPERVSMPDFDIDFGSGFHPVTGKAVGRDDVIAYVADKYNDPNNDFPSVGQIATHGLMAAKSGFKAIAKVLGATNLFSDDVTKEFPDKPETKIKDCLLEPSIEERYASEPFVRELIDLTQKSEGLKKSSGVHAGGVVIAPSEITDFSAVSTELDNTGKLIAQQDKNDIEKGGLVKFDFLGLFTLTTISYAIKNIFVNKGIVVDIDDIDMEDPKTFALLKQANSHGVFQVESAGMKDLLRRVEVDNIEELSALLALFRPGPIQSGMVDNFVDRKHGREKVAFPDEKYQHHLLEDILKPTYGIILYQEQVMQIAQALAKYTLGGADMLRRAMGKKKPEEMAKQRAVFEEGAVSNGVDGELAMKIFDLVEKFAGYGFNKSHSMAYAYISYQTAWLKAHYPTEYMAAVLTSQIGDMDGIKACIQDCKKNGIEVLPPDVNKSQLQFAPEGDKKIRYSLLAIHGVGDKAAMRIIAERDKNGLFEDTLNLKMRCRADVNKTTFEALVLSGTLDNFESTFEIPESFLRTINLPMPLLEADRVKQELELANEELAEIKSRFDTITGFGKNLRTIIESLTAHYSKKYKVEIDHSADLKVKMNQLWSYFGRTLTEISQNENNFEHNFIVNVQSDFSSLQNEVKNRSNTAKAYAVYEKDLARINKQIDMLKESLAESEASDVAKLKEWEQENAQQKHAKFDRRSYLLSEARHLSGANAKIIDSGASATICASYKDIELDYPAIEDVARSKLSAIDNITEEKVIETILSEIFEDDNVNIQTGKDSLVNLITQKSKKLITFIDSSHSDNTKRDYCDDGDLDDEEYIRVMESLYAPPDDTDYDYIEDPHDPEHNECPENNTDEALEGVEFEGFGLEEFDFSDPSDETLPSAPESDSPTQTPEQPSVVKVEFVTGLASRVFSEAIKLLKDAEPNEVRKLLTKKALDQAAIISDKDRLKSEMAALAYYTTGHPLDVGNLRQRIKARGSYTDLGNLKAPRIDPITNEPVLELPVRTAGTVIEIRKFKIKKEGKNFGKDMAKYTIDDGTGTVSITAFSDCYEVIKDEIFLGEGMCVSGTVQEDDFRKDGSLIINLQKVENAETGETIYERETYNFTKKQKNQKVGSQLAVALEVEGREQSLTPED